MLSINDNLPALKNLGRFESAVLKVKAESPSKMAICVSQGKSPYLQNSALKNIPTDCRLMWVFFLCAVTTTIDSLLKSAGCGVKIGYRQPLGASLAELVSFCTTWINLSGVMVNQWNISTRSAHLVLNRMEQEAKSICCLFAPLSKLLSNEIQQGDK